MKFFWLTPELISSSISVKDYTLDNICKISKQGY